MKQFVFIKENVVIGATPVIPKDGLEKGWHEAILNPPDCGNDEYAIIIGWERDGDAYRAIYEKRKKQKVNRKFSKLSIYGAIAQLGAWDAIKAWLEAKNINGINGWMAFQLAQEISEDHPLFSPMAEEARQLLGLTEEQFDALLNECILK